MSREFLVAMAPWLAVAGVDCYAALAWWPRPEPWQFALEIGLLLLLGRSQWKLARGWARTPLLASAVTLFFASTLYVPTLTYQQVPFLLGVAAGIHVLLRTLASRVTVSAATGVLMAILVVVGFRYADATTEQAHQSPWQSTLDDLVWPLRGRGPAATSDGLPVVLISVDTLRADSAQSMETVRRLRARGASWERAMSTSNWTLPALASLQTGEMPAVHGAGGLPGNHIQGIQDNVKLLAEQLSEAGYATAAAVANPWVTTATGFGRGFGTFIEVGNYIKRLIYAGPPVGEHRQDASHVVDAAVHWLRDAPARGFYLWVHVVDPHLPYPRARDPYLRRLTVEQIHHSTPPTEEQKKAMRVAYEEDVAYTDGHLVRLLNVLEAKGVLDHGLVVFTADHGEEFWEHEGFEHGHTHHGEVVDVPLVLVAPGVTPGERPGVASLLDVAPTIRAAAGLPPDGIDLRVGVPADRIATAWGGLLMHIDCSARDPSRRVIVRDCSAAPRLFDLQADPGEHHALPAPADDAVARAARSVSSPRQAGAANVNREALRMLGYQQ